MTRAITESERIRRELLADYLKMDQPKLADLAASITMRCGELEDALRRFVAYNDPAAYVNDQGGFSDLMSHFVRDFPVPVEALRGAAFNWIPKMSAEKAAGARLKRDKDGKQAAKQGAREWWEAWQADPGMYPGDTEFARVMLDKFPALTSTTVVTRWCRSWRSGSTQRAE